MKNSSNNPIFREIRELEEKALKAGLLKESEIKTSEQMRISAWKSYLVAYRLDLKMLLEKAK